MAAAKLAAVVAVVAVAATAAADATVTSVAEFQVGRIYGGGGAAIGFATSIDSGTSWANGSLPGITTFQAGAYSAVSDPSLAYDAKHGVWMASTLAINSSTERVLISR